MYRFKFDSDASLNIHRWKPFHILYMLWISCHQILNSHSLSVLYIVYEKLKVALPTKTKSNYVYPRAFKNYSLELFTKLCYKIITGDFEPT